MARYLFVVSRRDSALFTYLKERFADDTNVTIVLDRRQGERRRWPEVVPMERRRRDRRARPEVDAELQSSSYTVITLE